MKNTTNGFSFILKPSIVEGAGVGVFALHDIAKGTFMDLFPDNFQNQDVEYKRSDVPDELHKYCIDQEGDTILCPRFFNRMDIGNYLNHSKTPNVRYETGVGYFAKRDIHAGEEIFADYRTLGEPESTWEEYYTK